jgi:hypothetical protein
MRNNGFLATSRSSSCQCAFGLRLLVASRTRSPQTLANSVHAASWFARSVLRSATSPTEVFWIERHGAIRSKRAVQPRGKHARIQCPALDIDQLWNALGIERPPVKSNSSRYHGEASGKEIEIRRLSCCQHWGLRARCLASLWTELEGVGQRNEQARSPRFIIWRAIA